MGAKCSYPQFAELTAAELSGLIDRSRLSVDDRKIASCRLIWQMDMVDIAAIISEAISERRGYEVELDRSTISRRLKNKIVPELEHLIELEARQGHSPEHCAPGCFFIFGVV